MLINPLPNTVINRKIVLNTDTTVEPITTTELKFWGRIDGDYEDTILEGIIKTARKNVEDYIRQTLIQKTLEMHLDSWDYNNYELPLGPVISISSIVTLDEDDSETTYNDDYYYLTKGQPQKVVIKQDASDPINTERDFGGYKITYLAGYGTTADDVPQAIKDGVLLWATWIYENRDPNPEPPEVVKNALRNFIQIRL